MKRVYKYPFPIRDNFQLILPAGYQTLLAEVQNGQSCLWALIDPGATRKAVSFRVFGTGHDISHPDGLTHVASFQHNAFVWHLFTEATP